jgi:2-C-methyl-D-erythritol 2,4-cyclodiphosphate synthase
MVEHGYTLANADISVVCEMPRLAPHVAAMRQNLADDLGCAPGDVSVKATTSEKLGFAGRGEGIAAFAVVLLQQRPRGTVAVSAQEQELIAVARRFEPQADSDA